MSIKSKLKKTIKHNCCVCYKVYNQEHYFKGLCHYTCRECIYNMLNIMNQLNCPICRNDYDCDLQCVISRTCVTSGNFKPCDKDDIEKDDYTEDYLKFISNPQEYSDLQWEANMYIIQNISSNA